MAQSRLDGDGWCPAAHDARQWIQWQFPESMIFRTVRTRPGPSVCRPATGARAERRLATRFISSVSKTCFKSLGVERGPREPTRARTRGGFGGNGWAVTLYGLSYSTDGSTWQSHPQQFAGSVSKEHQDTGQTTHDRKRRCLLLQRAM